ncbi:hypothetical protein HXX76_007730 [Chlamydomonas incerta]|uniref:PPM-type phosphatase domain-containing protein n=1 Tax=Chlamydomonas incerta TaxID=51695 RepID=A0A835W0L2_CHLIN|nr:hypothetical protein HXX76_007730 [Chlamydomonas incerta]|eukprot:KAG2434845.1 hypothetical protein HXX76_007730 [Chlamydomonas incerta]
MATISEAGIDVAGASNHSHQNDDASTSGASPAWANAAERSSRQPSRGRTFQLSNIVSAARKSFELQPRQEEAAAAEPDPPPTMKRYYTQALWLDHQAGMHVAHAPPATMMDPPLPPESEEDEHEYVEHVDVKAISLEGLRLFVKQHNISPSMTTAQVVRSIVIPATMGRQGTEALIDCDAWSRFMLPPMDSAEAATARKAAGPLPAYTRMPRTRPITGLKRRAPYYYVVHAWSRPFLETVGMIEAHFKGRPAEHTYVWLDVFAVPQVSPDHGGFLHEIQRSIWYATSTLACIDMAGTILGRLWCCYEMFYTLISKQCAHALIALTPAPLSTAQRTALYRKIDSAKAQCSVKEDKKKLKEHVEGYTRRGFPAINNYLRSGLLLPPYDHEAVYLPQSAFEKTDVGLCFCLPFLSAPSKPPAPPPPPEHVAHVPIVPEPSVRKGMPGYGAVANGLQGMSHTEAPLRLVLGACNIPHPQKTKTGGEDAYFLSAAGRGAMGVADGVGSWSADDGVDPANYSRDLMRSAAYSIEASGANVCARMALADAHLTVKHAGSSTSMVALLPPDSNVLQVMNLGDSGLRLIRNGRLAMATRPQSHAHNMPYQLACPDEPVCDTDCTVQGDLYKIHLEAGDILIMATDGLFDNLWPEAMLEIVDKIMSSPLDDEDLTPGGAANDAAACCTVSPVSPALKALAGSKPGPDARAPVVNPTITITTSTGGEAPTGKRGPSPLGVSGSRCGSGSSSDAVDDTDAEVAATDTDTTNVTTFTGPAAVAAAHAAANATLSTDAHGIVSGASAIASPSKRGQLSLMGSGRIGPLPNEDTDGVGKHAPVAGDEGEAVRADSSTNPLPPTVESARAAHIARALARTAAANMLRRDVRTPFAVELSKQPHASPEFRSNPRGGKPDDTTVVVAVVVESDVQSLAAVQQACYKAYLTVNSIDTASRPIGSHSALLPRVSIRNGVA